MRLGGGLNTFGAMKTMFNVRSVMLGVKSVGVAYFCSFVRLHAPKGKTPY